MKIGILGCGWLGFPLGKELIKEGHEIKGSTTSKNKLKELSYVGITPFLISLSERGINGPIEAFLKNIEVLIINIPPRLKGKNKESYISKNLHLIDEIEETSIKKILFISSTAIYTNNNSLVTEKTKPDPQTQSGKQLLEVEGILNSNPNFKTTILRFGGLFGENRNPANFLSGKKNVLNPDAPVNLIHLHDCIEIIKLIIKNNIWRKAYNAASPNHPSKKEFYTKQAIENQMIPPEFNNDTPSIGKTIDSSKLISELNYEFKVHL